MLKAMAHPTRLMVLEELTKGERCVCDLQVLVGCDMSTMSKHLSVLRNEGLITAERRGTQIYYTLTVPCVMNFFQCADAVLKSNAARSAKLAR